MVSYDSLGADLAWRWISDGTVSLPNGLGLDYPDAEGERRAAGVAPNELTSLDERDPFAGTPLHKAVKAQLAALSVATV